MEISNIKFKKCSKCEEEKSLDLFGVDNRQNDKKHLCCKQCVNLYIKQLRKAKKDKGLISQKKTKPRQFYLDYYKQHYRNNKEHRKQYCKINKDRIKKQSAESRARRRVKLCEKSKNYYRENKEIIKIKRKAYRKKNIHVIQSNNANRRAIKKQSSFNYKYSKEISTIYKKCINISNDEKKYNVDHIIPLIHKDICGLHVPWNLQIITSEDNIKKSNKFDGTYDNLSWSL
jgi:hypothetical protein